MVDVLLSAVLERDEAGLTARSLAVLEDVTATRALQKELGRTHAHLDAVVDNMPALVGYWDRDAATQAGSTSTRPARRSTTASSR